MGHQVTILRTRNGAQLPISRAEVEEAIARRPGLATTPREGGGLTVSVPAMAELSPVLVWEDGEIRTNDPDDATIQLMLELAQAFGGGARVRSDALETYRAPGVSYRHPDDSDDLEETRQEVRSERRGEPLLTVLPVIVAFLIILIFGYFWHR